MKIIRLDKLPVQSLSHENPSYKGVVKKVLLTAKELTKRSVQMINWATLTPGSSVHSHSHKDMDELFIILSGRAKVIIDNEDMILERGDSVLLPSPKQHSMENLGGVDVEYLVIGLII